MSEDINILLNKIDKLEDELETCKRHEKYFRKCVEKAFNYSNSVTHLVCDLDDLEIEFNKLETNDNAKKIFGEYARITDIWLEALDNVKNISWSY